MLKRFQDLRVATKLSLIVVAMAIPIVAVVALFALQTNALIATAQNEARGLVHLAPVEKLFDHVTAHRDLTAGILSGARDAARLADDIAPLVDKDFAEIESVIAAGSDVYGSATAVAGIKSKWQAARQQGADTTPDASFAAHSEIVADIQALQRSINDASELILDPVLPSYYLMDVVVIQMPGLIDDVSRLRAAHLRASAGALSAAEQATMVADAATLRQRYVPVQRSIAVARNAEPSLNPLQTALDAAVQAATTFASRVEVASASAAPTAVATAAAPGSAPATPAVTRESTEAAYQDGVRAIQAATQLQAATREQLARLLAARAGDLRQSQFVQFAIGLLGLLVPVALSVWVVRSITTPVKSMLGLFGAIGMGDFKARAAVTSADELGTLATTLNAMLDNTTDLMVSRDERDQMQTSIQKLLDEVAGVAEGDLTREAEVSVDMTGAIADAVNQMIGELRRVIGDAQNAAGRVSRSAEQLQVVTHQLADGSEAQAAQIVETSAAVEEMAASITQVSENAASSATVAEQARSNAEQGTRAVTRTIEGMGAIRDQVQETAKRIKRLGESSQEIGEIVQLIGDIADRTSILALNASIQAAMAGEAGRGFAVVAEEVERLAERATDATKRISTLIKTTQSETAEAVVAMEDTTREVVNGSALANEAGVALSEIQNVSNRLAHLIQAISDASQQQAKGSEQVARAMGDISHNTRQTAVSTKATADSIGSLAGLANGLNSSMVRFKLPVVAGREKAA